MQDTAGHMRGVLCQRPDGMVVLEFGDSEGRVRSMQGVLAGGEPLRLTYRAGFDGMKSFSKDSSKMVFVRTADGGNALFNHVMDLSSLNLGPENNQGIPDTPVPDDAVLVTDFTVGR